MSRLVGLYIEDEIDNITVISEMFKLHDLQLEYIDVLPKDLSEYYRTIIEKNIDFVIIDNHLEKQVTYKGIDVLREIRRHDSNIYAVLLTNYPLEQFKDEFSEYDYEINKKDLRKRIEEIVLKIKRACALREENDLADAMEKSSEMENDTIDILKKISSQLDSIR